MCRDKFNNEPTEEAVLRDRVEKLDEEDLITCTMVLEALIISFFLYLLCCTLGDSDIGSIIMVFPYMMFWNIGISPLDVSLSIYYINIVVHLSIQF